ncbi:tetratricopeptide repeat protein [Gallaecimonas kandeliae]|uniref:YfgM family protein n=1 Tax=Gallaecimonas kandeliae TaxID=3029055 RepID=UPI00264712FB|nr:tetratricopeptide repeat protein [Gallaecimonas kandeliae]WKE64659.1 tetratricopeptide repeat protein [Gallaecimonas kandeliae]
MEIYSTEEQQVEAIKSFWKEHGNGIILGTLIGLAAIYGWRWYGQQQLAKQEQSSAAYAAALKKVDAGDLSAGDAFLKGDSAGQYQTLMAARLAKAAADKGELDKALGYLDQAQAHADTETLKGIFTLRKARIQLAKGDLKGAKASLALVKDDAFKAESQELLGDIAVKEGDKAAARTAYQAALAGQAGSPALQLKLESLDSKG